MKHDIIQLRSRTIDTTVGNLKMHTSLSNTLPLTFFCEHQIQPTLAYSCSGSTFLAPAPVLIKLRKSSKILEPCWFQVHLPTFKSVSKEVDTCLQICFKGSGHMSPISFKVNFQDGGGAENNTPLTEV